MASQTQGTGMRCTEQEDRAGTVRNEIVVGLMMGSAAVAPLSLGYYVAM